MSTLCLFINNIKKKTKKIGNFKDGNYESMRNYFMQYLSTFNPSKTIFSDLRKSELKN